MLSACVTLIASFEVDISFWMFVFVAMLVIDSVKESGLMIGCAIALVGLAGLDGGCPPIRRATVTTRQVLGQEVRIL